MMQVWQYGSMVRTTITLSGDQHRRLRVQAAQAGVSMSKVLLDAWEASHSGTVMRKHNDAVTPKQPVAAPAERKACPDCGLAVGKERGRGHKPGCGRFSIGGKT